MGTINPDWYAGNATRAYPLDDAATARDDAGRELPPQILVDCRIRFPVVLGQFAYVGAITVGPSIVTAILMAAPDAAQPPIDAIPGDTGLQPLGAVTLPRPVQSNRHYPIQPMAAGVGGWLVFGRGIDEFYSGRFSTPGQSLLLPRVASAYRPLPVPSLGKLGLDQSLTGVVQLLGGADLEVIQDTREIDGGIVDAIVIRLVDSLNRNVFDRYKGPCGGRPESRTCDKPALEAINTVVPDCNGNLVIDFHGVNVIDFAGGGGQALDLSLGMADTCLGQDYLPDDTGKLPGEYEDKCLPTELPEDCVPLPYYESFDGAIPTAWVVKFGTFAIENDDSPGEPAGSPVNKSYAATDQSDINVVIWDCDYDVLTLDLTCTTHLKLMAGDQTNGGIVFDYVASDPTREDRPTYFLASINPLTGFLEINWYNGYTIEMAVGFPFGAVANKPIIGDWYELTVHIRKNPAALTDPVGWMIGLKLKGVTNPVFPTIDVEQPWPISPVPGGKCGLGSKSAHCLFSFFQLGAIEVPGVIPPEAADCVPLPYYESFDGDIPTAWVVPVGTFAIEGDDSPGELYGLEGAWGGQEPGHTSGLTGLPPLHRATWGVTTPGGPVTPPVIPIHRSYTAVNRSQRNVSVWNCNYNHAADLTCLTHLKLMAGPQVNGGIVVNYIASDPLHGDRPVYQLVAVDVNVNSLVIWTYFGTSITRSVSFPLGTGAGVPLIGDWYELSVRSYKGTVGPGFPNQWLLGLKLKGVTNPAYPQLSVNQPAGLFYTTPTGKFGLGTVNAYCRFSFFQLELT